jgi:hypothetical protein
MRPFRKMRARITIFFLPHGNRQNMKPLHMPGFPCFIILLIICAGCTGTTPPATPAPTPVPVTTTIATPVPTPTPYPGALALNAEAPFGTGGKNGTATVYKVDLRTNYSWTSPSFNSPHEQAKAGDALGTQQGYNTEEPAAGNAFLFTYVRLADTGTESMVAPSPNQFVVNYNGKDYAYSSLRGSDVTIGTVRGTQYDYLIGKGGVSGYIQPGSGNAADGFLIYEVPASIDLSKAALVITLDSRHQSAWQLG